VSEVSKEKVIICRCNNVSQKDIEDLIDEGITDIEVIKRVTRAGMGPCQGRTCVPLIVSLISRKAGIKIEDIKIPPARIPVRYVPMGIFALEDKDDEENE